MEPPGTGCTDPPCNATSPEAIVRASLGRFGKLLFAQFGHRFREDFLVGLKADIGDKSALLTTQQIARPTDIEVLHRNIEAGPQVGKLLDGPQPPPCVARKHLLGGREQVTESLAVRPPHTAPELVQIAQSEVLRVVDDDRIGIGHVDARLDDRRGHQHVELAVDKVHHQLSSCWAGICPCPTATRAFGQSCPTMRRTLSIVSTLLCTK